MNRSTHICQFSTETEDLVWREDEPLSLYEEWILYIQFLHNDTRCWFPTSGSSSGGGVSDAVSNIERDGYHASTDTSTESFHCKQ